MSDLALGQSAEISVEITSGLVDQFTTLSGDHSTIHVSDEFARSQGFAGRIAHGLLIGSLISGLIGTRLPGLYGVLQSVDLGFRKPVVPPETVQITGTIASISAGTGQITVNVVVTNERGDTVATAKVRTIVREPQ